MKKNYNFFIIIFLLTVTVLCISSGESVFAQPYGMGYYGAQVPYGGQTSLTISTSGNISIPITPTSSRVSNSATGTVTVVSTDVVGYQLYISAQSTSNLVNGAYTIPTSSNSSPAALAVDTWGYNLDGSSNYVGISTTNTLIKSFSGPAESGDTTSVTYGVNVDDAIAAGSYATTVMYTAVPQTN